MRSTSAGAVRRPSITTPRASRSISWSSGTPRTRTSYSRPTPWSWMRQHRRQVAVARQDQQAFRLVVESSDRIDVVADPVAREKVDDRRTMLRIDAAGDVAAGLVQEKVTATCRRLDSSPIDPDVVRLRIRFRSELQNRRVVDRDAALRDELLRGAARERRRPSRESSEGGSEA